MDGTSKPQGKWHLSTQFRLWAVILSTTPALALGVVSQYTPDPILSVALGSGLTAIAAILVTNQLTEPLLRRIRNIHTVVNQVSPSKPTTSQENELALLEGQMSQLAQQIQSFSEQQANLTQQRQILSSLAFRSRQEPKLDVLFETVVNSARQFLKTDRVCIYRFNADWSGTMIAESVAPEYPKALNETIVDPCFRQRHAVQYANGRIRGVDDIYNEPGMTDCHIRLLEQYRVRANLVVPIRQDEELFGLLITHQCSGPRVWTMADVDFLSKLATEMEYSLDYINFFDEQAAMAKRSWLFGEIAFRARQSNLEDVLKTTTQGVRQLLQVDRVLIYRFNADWSGTMIAESVGSGFSSILQEKIDDPCFRGRYVDLYKNGRIRAIKDIRREPGLTDCHIRTLEKYEVKANLVAPIRLQGELMGLLIAHQCSEPRSWTQADLSFFSQVGTQLEYAIGHLTSVEQLRSLAERSRLLGDISFRSRQTFDEMQILQVAVQGALKILHTDRVIIYRFRPDRSGCVIAEAINPGWPQALNAKIYDPCFNGRYVEKYKNGRVRAINNIHDEPGMTDCYIRLLEQFEVKANLIAPLRRNNKLYGLLIAHHCSESRNWSKSEIDFFSELAVQTEYALEHIRFIRNLEQTQKIAETASQEQQQQTEMIQQQLNVLRNDMQGAFNGNLTVRAEVQEGDIGVFANFLNGVLENLQRIVLQVQSASDAVAQTVHMGEVPVRTLSTEALRQTKAIEVAQDQVQAIAESIQTIAANAKQAKLKVQQANQVLQDGDATMNRTVDGISAIQETVEETAQKVKQLGEASQKISRVLNLIRELANQTNVLALNASIEANASGDKGQGFAVVAEEVRSLAERSAIATREIEQIVEEIQTETEQVVTAMEAGREQVIAGTTLVATTRQNLLSIVTVSSEIHALVEDMAKTATAQTQTSASVAKKMQEVEQIAQQNSQQAVLVADSFTNLLGVAENLQESVEQFKVK
jgi:methyl-accepting chemotaxis protein PixJ